MQIDVLTELGNLQHGNDTQVKMHMPHKRFRPGTIGLHTSLNAYQPSRHINAQECLHEIAMHDLGLPSL